MTQTHKTQTTMTVVNTENETWVWNGDRTISVRKADGTLSPVLHLNSFDGYDAMIRRAKAIMDALSKANAL